MATRNEETGMRHRRVPADQQTPSRMNPGSSGDGRVAPFGQGHASGEQPLPAPGAIPGVVGASKAAEPIPPVVEPVARMKPSR